MMPLLHSPHSQLVYFDKNSAGTDYIVGDIHGHYERLMSQLNELNFDFNNDRLFCVGDLIDRGPDSPKVLSLLSESWFFSLLGNHEYYMLSGLKYNNSKHKMLWLQNGGDWIANSTPGLWGTWFEQLAQLPIAMQLTGQDDKLYGLVHADFPSDHWGDYSDFSQTELETCLSSRRNFAKRSNHTIKGIDYVVHGHNVTGNTANGESEPLMLGNRLYIEPGVYKGERFIIMAI